MERSPFQRLPAELRNSIYERALSAPGPISGRYSHKDAAWTFELTFKYGITLGITRTCRQIYNESKDLVFALNSFEIKATFDGITGSWLRFSGRFLGLQLSLMRSIAFYVEHELCELLLWREQINPLLAPLGIRLIVRVSEGDESVPDRRVVVMMDKFEDCRLELALE